MKKIKINLGCGQDLKDGWINLDVIEKFKPDVVHDLLKPLPFSNDFADYILSQDILEHFIIEDLEKLLQEIARVLKVGGKLEVRVPNLEDIFERFANDCETRNQFIYGTTIQTGVFGAHKVGFTPLFLVSLMLKNNLELVTWQLETTNYLAIFRKVRSIQKIKKLVLINQTLGMGGAEVFLSDLLAEFEKKDIFGKRRWQVIVYTNNLRFKKLLEKSNIKTKFIPTVVDVIGDWKGLVKGFFFWPVLVVRYWQIIKQEMTADLFIMSGFPEKILFSPLASFFSKPVVWVEFGPMTAIFKKFKRLPKILYFLVKNIPQLVVTPSLNSSNNLTTEGRISLAKLRIIPCGRNLVVSRNAISEGEKNLVTCVSRLEKGKGQDLLIEAFAKVIKKIPTAKLRIVGEGDFAPVLQNLIKKLNLDKNVELVGRVSASLVEMKRAQVVVFPSVWPLEGFGLVMIEAMSLGKSVVAFDHGPAPEIIEDEQNGLLVKKNNVTDLANKIILLLQSDKLRLSLGKQARLDFSRKYQIKKTAQNYDEVFKQALCLHQARLLNL